MKQKMLIITAGLAALFGAPPGFRTANAASAPVAAQPEAEDTSTLALLCKGAGVDMADVRWRVAAGLDPKLAVDAALAQKAANEEAAKKAAAAKKGGEK